MQLDKTLWSKNSKFILKFEFKNKPVIILKSDHFKMTSKVTQYYKSYFPERKGVSPRVELNQNYTEETLKYTMKPKTAEYISNRIEEFTGDSPYFVIEGGAGIGGNTMEFLSRDKVATVMAFEKNEERSNMLKRNIMAYNFGDRAIVMNIEMNGAVGFDSYKNAVFYFDPPWTFGKKDLMIGDLTLDGWLEKLNEIAYMVVFRTEPNYVLRPVAGWTCYQEDIMIRGMNQGRLYICIPNYNLTGELGVDVSKDEILKNLKPLDSTLGTRFNNFVSKCNKKPFKEAINDNICKKFVKYSYLEEKLNKITSVQGTVKKTSEPEDEEKETMAASDMDDFEKQVHMFNDIIVPSKDLDPNSPEWAAEFSVYLKQCLSRFLDEDKCNQLVGPDNMHYWFQAFTHETFNPEITENYENLEYFGDKVSGASFALLLFEMRGGRIDKSELTSYQGVYMSEDFQTLVGARTFGFTNWIRCGINKTPKMNEDVFESFVGALHQAGDNCKKGWGFYLCRLFINFVCSKIVLTEDDAKGGALQRAKQNLEKIGLKNKVDFEPVEYKNPDGTIIMKFTLKNKAIERIRQLGFDVPADGVMGIGVSTKKKKAEIRAAIDANQKFDEIGLTQKFFDEFQRNRALKLIKKENYELYELTNKKLEEEGFKDTYQFEVATSKSKNREFYTITLTGINKKGKTITLGVGKNENKLEAYTEAAMQYVSRI